MMRAVSAKTAAVIGSVEILCPICLHVFACITLKPTHLSSSKFYSLSSGFSDPILVSITLLSTVEMARTVAVVSVTSAAESA
jgi:hypothetical protein